METAFKYIFICASVRLQLSRNGYSHQYIQSILDVYVVLHKFPLFFLRSVGISVDFYAGRSVSSLPTVSQTLMWNIFIFASVSAVVPLPFNILFFSSSSMHKTDRERMETVFRLHHGDHRLALLYFTQFPISSFCSVCCCCWASSILIEISVCLLISYAKLKEYTHSLTII